MPQFTYRLMQATIIDNKVFIIFKVQGDPYFWPYQFMKAIPAHPVDI